MSTRAVARTVTRKELPGNAPVFRPLSGFRPREPTYVRAGTCAKAAGLKARASTMRHASRPTRPLATAQPSRESQKKVAAPPLGAWQEAPSQAVGEFPIVP